MGCSGSKPTQSTPTVAVSNNPDSEFSNPPQGSVVKQSPGNTDQPESAHSAELSTSSNVSSQLPSTSQTRASMSQETGAIRPAPIPEEDAEEKTPPTDLSNMTPILENQVTTPSIPDKVENVKALSASGTSSNRHSVSFEQDIYHAMSNHSENLNPIEQPLNREEQEHVKLEQQMKELEMQRQKEIDLMRKQTELERPPPSPGSQKEYVAHNRPDIILPSDPRFTSSINGRNNYKHTDVYTIGTSEEDVLGEGSFGKVYRAKHKLAKNEFEEHSDDEDGDDIHPRDIASKKVALFGPSNGGVEHNDILPRRSRKSRFNPVDEWKGYVAIKTTKPTALDTKGGRQLRTYDDVENFCAEIKMLIRLRGENARSSPCLYMYEYFYTGRSELQVVTELLGQELDQWRNNFVTFHESDAMAAAKQILIGIEFMHSRQVVHRDIKLQNILFQYNSRDPKTLKIVDFGLARVLKENQTTRDFCGSLGYIAPEIYQRKPYRFEVDMFAFGVLLFRLLSGERPFPSNHQDVLQRHTIELRYNVQGRDWQNVSDPAKELIRHLLINRQERWSATECLQHEWFLSQGRSVLRAELSIIGDRSDGGTRSRAFLQTEVPTNSGLSSRAESNRFWIDGALQEAIGILNSVDAYYGIVVEATGEGPAGMICVEEHIPPDLFPLPEYISQRGTYTENDCRFICQKLAEAIQCMHHAGMAHRNLHMENVLSNIFGQISIKGFQYAQAIEEGRPLTGHFGYLYSWFAFKAPEVDSAFYHDQSVDLWSFGAILYMLLTGIAPFRGNGAELIDTKKRGVITFEIFAPSDAAQDLVSKLLRVNPRDRLTIDEVLRHEWMTAPDDFLEQFDLQMSLEFMRDWRET